MPKLIEDPKSDPGTSQNDSGKEGCAKLNIRQIAKLGGISRNGYTYFPTKRIW